ncbi:hypothetical protein NC652_010843 [Populus alba x Populus x berolinensis]|nr:hypothetical protein NC652_010843 [Populus alba x Populus x berolinensis]
MRLLAQLLRAINMMFLAFQVDDVEFMKETRINPIKVAKALVEIFAEMIFVHGFVHGDPHPGNILVSPEGPNGFTLVILDHGIYKQLDEGFRQDYCQLWKAMILQDTHKIQQLGKGLGVGKYAKYLPVIFLGRTINSKAILGKGMSDEEKSGLKQELNDLRVDDLFSFMESLPPDFLTILRTDGLLRSVIRKLGAPQNVRLLAYVKYAIRGLSPKLSPESDSSMKVTFSRLRTNASYLQLRLFLVSCFYCIIVGRGQPVLRSEAVLDGDNDSLDMTCQGCGKPKSLKPDDSISQQDTPLKIMRALLRRLRQQFDVSNQLL